MSGVLEKINQSIWELREQIRLHPEEHSFRKDLLRFFYESAIFVERRAGVPEKDRSFLMLKEREAIAVLLIHGAGGSPDEMRQLGNYLFGLGFTVLGIRLPLESKSSNQDLTGLAADLIGLRKRDSGRRGRISSGGSWFTCLAQSEIALDTLLAYSPQTYIAGFSFGGTISLNLLRKYPVAGTLLISPGLFPNRGTRFSMFWTARKLMPSLTERIMPIKSTILDLVERTRTGFEPIDSPVLVIQAADDPVISPRGYQFLHKRCKNPKSRFVLLPSGGHVIIKGDQSERVFRICGEFIKSI
jgi:carboxylesterase